MGQPSKEELKAILSKEPSEMTPEELVIFEQLEKEKNEYIEKNRSELQVIEDELKQILNEKYDVELKRIDFNFEFIPTLDSIDNLNFLLDVKRKYDLTGEASDLPACKTLGDVVIIVHKGLKQKLQEESSKNS